MGARKQPLRGAIKARVHTPLLKGKTRADEVAKMADDLGMPLMPWQKWVLDDMMRVDAKGMYIRKTSLLLVARQNGKSHLGRMRIIWGLFYGGETKHLIMSSNRATALMTFREIAWIIENAPHLKAGTKAIRYANGGERIPKSFGFYEYSAPQYCKITDRSGWAQANPALGYTITEEALEESVATSPIENTRTELLCQWIDSLSSPWTHGSLEECSDNTLELAVGAYTVFAFDVSPSRRNASLVIGQILPDGRIGVGLAQTWESQVSVDELKIAADIKGWADQYRPRSIGFDRYATQSIADRLANAGQVVQDISGAQFYQACTDLKDHLDNKKMVHSGQEGWIQQMNNCAAKTNDSSWRIIKRKSAGDISGAIATAMVVTTLSKPQQTAMIYSE
jgi:phage terminase large subunit-like protein